MMRVKCEKCKTISYSAASIVKCDCGGTCFSVDPAYNNGNGNKKNIKSQTNGGK